MDRKEISDTIAVVYMSQQRVQEQGRIYVWVGPLAGEGSLNYSRQQYCCSVLVKCIRESKLPVERDVKVHGTASEPIRGVGDMT